MPDYWGNNYYSKKNYDGTPATADVYFENGKPVTADEFLEKEGLKDDVLLIFTTDNGTAGKRAGGLKGKKGSHYEGGHNVPCFWRWKNGGIGGASEKACKSIFCRPGALTRRWLNESLPN